MKVKMVDAGVNYKFKFHPSLINAKVGMGTNNFAEEPAMSKDDCFTAIQKGSDVVTKFFEEGSNVIGFGEMGVGSSTSASAILSLILNIPVEDIVGYGSGLDKVGLRKKIEVLKKAIQKHNINKNDPIEILSTFGGFEIAMICGGMLRAAQLNMIIVADGYISTAAAVMAYLFNKNVLGYIFFSHLSNEKSHWMVLESLQCRPILNLDISLGEGVGVALAYPIIKSAVAFFNEVGEDYKDGLDEDE
jgi:nicotinate-nucleotide--dimethylbenzimidazole phosphoribosyltransferase